MRLRVFALDTCLHRSRFSYPNPMRCESTPIKSSSAFDEAVQKLYISSRRIRCNEGIYGLRKAMRLGSNIENDHTQPCHYAQRAFSRTALVKSPCKTTRASLLSAMRWGRKSEVVEGEATDARIALLTLQQGASGLPSSFSSTAGDSVYRGNWSLPISGNASDMKLFKDLHHSYG